VPSYGCRLWEPPNFSGMTPWWGRCSCTHLQPNRSRTRPGQTSSSSPQSQARRCRIGPDFRAPFLLQFSKPSLSEPLSVHAPIQTVSPATKTGHSFRVVWRRLGSICMTLVLRSCERQDIRDGELLGVRYAVRSSYDFILKHRRFSRLRNTNHMKWLRREVCGVAVLVSHDTYPKPLAGSGDAVHHYGVAWCPWGTDRDNQHVMAEVNEKRLGATLRIVNQRIPDNPPPGRVSNHLANRPMESTVGSPENRSDTSTLAVLAICCLGRRPRRTAGGEDEE
jgi:hypothetical protein